MKNKDHKSSLNWLKSSYNGLGASKLLEKIACNQHSEKIKKKPKGRKGARKISDEYVLGIKAASEFLRLTNSSIALAISEDRMWIGKITSYQTRGDLIPTRKDVKYWHMIKAGEIKKLINDNA